MNMKTPSRVSVVLVLLLAGLSVASAHAQPVLENTGAAVARRSCSQCHAIGATGDSANVDAPRFRDLHKRFVIPDLQDRLLAQLMLSHPNMPRFRLSMEELTGLIAYLKSIQTDKLSLAPAAADRPARG
jgi:mono/diheme cytochrome c family protein